MNMDYFCNLNITRHFFFKKTSKTLLPSAPPFMTFLCDGPHHRPPLGAFHSVSLPLFLPRASLATHVPMGAATLARHGIAKSLLLLPPLLTFFNLSAAGVWDLCLHGNDFRVKDRRVKNRMLYPTHYTLIKSENTLLLVSGFLNQDSNDNGTGRGLWHSILLLFPSLSRHLYSIKWSQVCLWQESITYLPQWLP